MKQTIFKIIAAIGFLLVWGAAGGLENGGTFGEALPMAAAGLMMMGAGVLFGKEQQGGRHHG